MTRSAIVRALLAAVVIASVSSLPVTRSAAAAAPSCAVPSGAAAAIPLTPGQSVTVTGTTDDTRYVCLSGAVANVPVLDATASVPAGTDLLLCAVGIPDPGNPGTAASSGRSSHVTGTTTQRVAFSSPRYPEYAVSLHAVGSGGVQEPCLAVPPGGSAARYSLTVKYVDSAPPPAGAFQFETKHLPRSTPSLSDPGGGEPSIAVDRLHGDRVYISTPVGVAAGPTCLEEFNTDPNQHICNGTNFWFSLDAGRTFTFCNASTPNGGGDSALAVDTTGSIYGADLAATNLQTQKLASTGPNAPPTPARGSDGNCNLANTGPTGPAADRQWLATYLPDPSQGTSAAKVYLSYNSLASGTPLECIGVQGGLAFPACANMISDPLVAADAGSNAVNGNQVFDSKGNIYSVFSTSTAASNAANGAKQGAQHNIYVASSANGAVFANHPVYLSQPQGSADTADSVNIYRLFPVIAVDRADNLYVTWPETRESTGLTNVKMAYSTDHGVTWSEPALVNLPSLKSNVLPWIVAGDDGMVDIAWVGSPATSLIDTTHDWNVYMAQSTRAHSGHPVFTQAQVSPQPIRYAALCFRGTFCITDGDEGRILLDFINIDLDSHGMANITYANAGPETAGYGIISSLQPFTDYAHQVGGASICTSGCAPPGYHPTTAATAGTPNTAAPAPWRAFPVAALVVLVALAGLLGRRVRS